MFRNTIDFDNLPTNQYETPPQGFHEAKIEEIQIIRWVNNQKFVVPVGEPFEVGDSLAIKYYLIKLQKSFIDNLSIWHSNDTVATIARHLFKNICTVCNKSASELTTFESLYHIPMLINIKYSNKIKPNGSPYVNVSKIESIPTTKSNPPQNNPLA